MDIRFHGQLTQEHTLSGLQEVFQLLVERYQVQRFKEVHVSLILVDAQGFEVDLVDSDTHQTLRVLDVDRREKTSIKKRSKVALRLVKNQGT